MNKIISGIIKNKNINEELDSIDLENLSSSIIEDQYRQYFLGMSGSEHYRLLAYLSKKFNNELLLDIGTYKGCSSIALAFNNENKVKSFDIVDVKALSNFLNNVDYIINDCTNTDYEKDLIKSKFILLDTAHDGQFEYKMYNKLKQLNWVGILMLDDIHLNEEMKKFWNDIEKEKYDTTSIGHHSGTGIVIFK